MKKLLDLDPDSPTIFTQEDLTGHFNKLPVGRTHNIVVNEELGYAIAAGSVGGNETVRNRDNLPCRGGLIFINMTDPTNPTTPGCAAGDGYVHDAQCLVYRGPDIRYQGRDVCYGYNEGRSAVFPQKLRTLSLATDVEFEFRRYSYHIRCHEPDRQHDHADLSHLVHRCKVYPPRRGS